MIGEMMSKDIGCHGCDFLKWYEADFEESCDSGYYCEVREIPTKNFPLKRKCNRWQKTEIINGLEVVIGVNNRRLSG